jgi:16S rRNA G966 N2-methylase RsmD
VLALRDRDAQKFELVAAGKAKANKVLRDLKHRDARAKAAEQARANPTQALIYRADAFAFLQSFQPLSIDLISTDPPYSTDVEDIAKFASEFVPLALSRLKLTGRMFLCTGSYPIEVQAYLDVLLAQKPFTVGNMLHWTYQNTIGPIPQLDYKLNEQTIYHVRGPEAPPLVPPPNANPGPIMTERFSVWEINAPDGRLGDRYHAWQKPDELCERIIRHASEEGQLVVDPFAGTGSFLLAAAKLGRIAIGCEIADNMIQIAKERGCVLADAATAGVGGPVLRVLPGGAGGAR